MDQETNLQERIETNQKKRIWLALGLIYVLWTALTLWNIDWGVPAQKDYLRSYYADESYVFYHVSQMRPSTLFSPGRFSNGCFYFFVAAAGTAAAYVLGYAGTAGRVFYENNPELLRGLYTCTRLAYSLFAFGCLPLTYLIGKRLYGRFAGLAAAAFLAVCPFFVLKSHIIKEDTILLFFLLFSVYSVVRAWNEEGGSHRRWFLLSGLALGFATATKWLGVLFFWVPLFGLYLNFVGSGKEETALTQWFAPLREKRFYVKGLLLIGMMTLGFVILCPYLILTPHDFIAGAVGQQLGTSRIGGAFKEPALDSPISFTVSNFLFFHLLNLGQHGLGWPLFALCAVGIIWSLFRLKKGDLLILSIPLFWFLFMGRWKTAIVSYDILPLPFLVILAGRFSANLCTRNNSKLWQTSCSILLFGILALTLTQTVAYVQALGYPRTQDQIKEFILAENLPGGEMIADAEAFNWWSPPVSSEIYPQGNLFYSTQALADSEPVAVITHDYVRHAYEAHSNVYLHQNLFLENLKQNYSPAVTVNSSPGWGDWRYEKKRFRAPFWEAILGPELTLWVKKDLAD